VRFGYFTVLVGSLFCAPVILADGFVLIPMLMVFIAAVGPLNALVAKLPTCADCGAPIEPAAALQAKSA
jgi:hypothetical protein